MTNEVNSSLHAFETLKQYFNPYAEEVWAVALNSHLQVLGREMIFRGTADQCLIHPRDIFRFLILSNASSFILAHNHPSKEVLPSDQDLILTRKIHNAGVLFQIPLQDHIIFSKEKYFSMADHGYFKSWKKSFRAEKFRS
ncbi:JAB domain-containing protein [Bdellovibrio svalbardensis]|uniref:JAB domain-containing protein n=1 Tax=Bdellovibrio svalbardensis TaxID=2972972 RepID=A0ABT6DD27_9BACT|nr:JAB domain-containing protein [Bdellovibrio svalbardensis]MDG0814746.1 JAB domain-containing protein [Bdellovibrio svalbardensis]